MRFLLIFGLFLMRQVVWEQLRQRCVIDSGQLWPQLWQHQRQRCGNAEEGGEAEGACFEEAMLILTNAMTGLVLWCCGVYVQVGTRRGDFIVVKV